MLSTAFDAIIGCKFSIVHAGYSEGKRHVSGADLQAANEVRRGITEGSTTTTSPSEYMCTHIPGMCAIIMYTLMIDKLTSVSIRAMMLPKH
jgi:hypothetical protein